MNCNTIDRPLNGSVPPVDHLYCSNDRFCIPVMLLWKQHINKDLTLHTPMERASNQNACNHRKQGASALGFTLDQCSEMGDGNLDTREAVKCIGLVEDTQLAHFLWIMFLLFILEAISTESQHLLSVCGLYRWFIYKLNKKTKHILSHKQKLLPKNYYMSLLCGQLTSLESSTKDKVRAEVVEKGWGWPFLLPRGHK